MAPISRILARKACVCARLERALFMSVVVACLAIGCAEKQAEPLVEPASIALFEHFLVDRRPPGGAECCTDVLAAGDIDGDGFLDLVLGGENADGAGLVWYEYPAWERHTVAEGQFTTDGEVVDFDGDGDQDVVVGDTSRGLVWITNANGGNDWATHTLVPNQYVHDLEVADLNGDGTADLVITDKKALRIYLINNLQVTATIVPVESPGEGLDVADMDGDGDVDILFGNQWVEQNGSSEWTPREIAPAWTVNTRTLAADMNGDGRLDVVLTGSEGDAAVAWFEAVGAGEPWVEHVVSTAPFTGAHSLAVLDVDGDDHLDVVVAEMHTSPSRRIAAFLQRDERWELVTLASHGSHNMIAADVDGDGDMDMAGKNYAEGRFLEYWDNRAADRRLSSENFAESGPAWQYDPITTTRPASDHHKFGLLLADVNDDNRLDVVAGGSAYVNSGGSSPAQWQARSVSTDADIIHVLPTSRNGWRQLLGVTESELVVLSAGAAGGETWSSESVTRLPSGRTQGYVASPPAADGSYDFYFTRGTTLQKLHVRATGSPNDSAPTELRDDVEESGLALADLDSDGDLDIVAVEGNGKRLRLLEAAGDEYRNHKAGASLYWIDRVATADLDGDGRLDIVYTEENRDGRYNTHVRWLKAPPNPWSGAWQLGTIAVLRSANSLDVADVDRDGDIDLVVAEHTDLRANDIVTNNFTGIFFNNGDATWTPEVVEIGAHSSHIGAQTGDLNGDGDLEIVSVGWEQTCCVHRWRQLPQLTGP